MLNIRKKRSYLSEIGIGLFMLIFIMLPTMPLFLDLSWLPEISIILLFYYFIEDNSKGEANKSYYLIIFLFGIFYDVYHLYPIGTTSLILLIIGKIYEKCIKYLPLQDGNNLSSIVRFLIFNTMVSIANNMFIKETYVFSFVKFAVDMVFYMLFINIIKLIGQNKR